MKYIATIMLSLCVFLNGCDFLDSDNLKLIRELQEENKKLRQQLERAQADIKKSERLYKEMYK